MKRALVAEAEPDLRDFVVDTLRTNGWDVEVATEKRVSVSDDVDAVVADLGTAVRNHWIGESAQRPDGAKLVITSAVGAFLEDVRDDVHAVVRTPTTSEDFVDAIEHGAHKLSQTDSLARPSRQEALEQCGLYSAKSDPELTAVAALAARAVGAKIGLVTLIDAKQQTFLGQFGLPPDLAQAGGTPRKWSFCQYVVQSKAPLVVEDALAHPSLSKSPLVTLGFARSYAGVPIVQPGIGPVGAVCVLDEHERTFDSTHLASLELAAGLAARRFEAIAHERPHAAYAVRPTAPAVFEVGDVIDDKFVVTARLGEGGQANVYLARDRFVGQLVAIKIQRTGSDPSIVHEGKALARLRHRSIVQLYGWGCLKDGTVYLVLEFVEGETLHRHVSTLRRHGERMPVPEIVDVTRSIAGALATLHAFSRLHGDVKPANVILDSMLHRPVLIDFGLGVALDGVTRVAGGTPGYSAPEQLDAVNPPVATPGLDAYGLACLAYVMFTGHGAFEGPRERALERQRRGEFQPVRVLRPELPATVDEVFRQAFHPDPSLRFETPIFFADALAVACSARLSLMPPPIRSEENPQSHGIVFSAVRESVGRLIGAKAEAELFLSLSPETRRVFESAKDPIEFYPTGAYVEYLRAYSASDPQRLEALGVVIAALIGGHALRQLRVSHTPETLLHVASELMHRYHDWGQTRVRRTGSHAATLELTAPRSVLPEFCQLFAGVLRALLMATGRHANVEQTHCAHTDNCAACTFDVRWTELGVV